MTNLLLGYAIVEGVIGLLGLLFHQVSIGVTSWAFDSGAAGGSIRSSGRSSRNGRWARS